jgi:hypothetical protein
MTLQLPHPSFIVAGCNRLALLSTDGNRTYCGRHLEEYRLTPAQKLCSRSGCFNPASYSQTGEHEYCTAHMREHGQQPMARFMPCEEPGCRRQRRLSTTYERRYCLQHMTEHGMQVGEPCRAER